MDLMRSDTPAASLQGVGKSFGHFRALSDVTLDIAPGTAHAFIGANGAGKSTTMGLLSGRLTPSQGHIEVQGRRLAPGDPRASRAAGIVAIYQELTIVPDLSAADNVFLGQFPSRRGLLRQGEMRQRFLDLGRRLRVAIPPDERAGRLSIADQQMLEIMRGLEAKARMILLDEPTAALAPPERRILFDRLAELRGGGVTIVLVSHNLDEVLAIADQISVFRDGRLVESRARSGWTKRGMVGAMLGHGPPEIGSATAGRAQPRPRAPVLEATGIEVEGLISDIDIALREGEIVGIGGLVGSGRSTLLRALAGLEPRARGRIRISGDPARPLPRTPRQALDLGIALVPEDRKGQGLALSMTARDNILLSDFAAVATGGLLSERMMTARAAALASAYGFDAHRLSVEARHLSGGNQQKLLLARWSHRKPRVLLADEPTRGVDVGAKEEILLMFRRLADEGLAIILVSSELEEIAANADRILVLSAGKPAGWLPAGSHVSQILDKAFAVEPPHG
ncbi:sugar ABC transporter ATP-binding protein [Inquilinus limosus]|uniref:Sugar ABC transporter ATP-binding protein n=1 Tax=Inquilinus limosus TaxID=171674 RepID=A0A211ZF43_9PROT|nr:sugar ABC transporter ATP-binding protein [Inquilinus limosus]OWJ63737.1 sugar ABC transporter ATP-binding protein [Inquilinus limosus]